MGFNPPEPAARLGLSGRDHASDGPDLEAFPSCRVATRRADAAGIAARGLHATRSLPCRAPRGWRRVELAEQMVVGEAVRPEDAQVHAGFVTRRRIPGDELNVGLADRHAGPGVGCGLADLDRALAVLHELAELGPELQVELLGRA